MITGSHNPYQWNGVKFKSPHGGSAPPATIRRVEGYLQKVHRSRGRTRKAKSAPIEAADLITPYLERLKTLVNLERIRASGRRFVIDPMYGAARGCVANLFDQARI